jgi:hypothetical protein
MDPMLDAFLENAVKVCAGDVRVSALLAGGSVAAGSVDRFSDLDLVVACRTQDYESMLAGRRAFAGLFGELRAAFTGEHVGEPRLLICLYDNPLLHVDWKFVRAVDLAERAEEPLILLDKDGTAAACLARGRAEWPSHGPEWFEERFWIWMHYGACKIGRGELFEAIDLLGWVRGAVLGPMIAGLGGHRQRGMRHVEAEAPTYTNALAGTLAHNDKGDCWRALKCTIRLYLDLRSAKPPARCNRASEHAVVEFIKALSREDASKAIPAVD